jgi:hypothetical protein
VKKFNYFSAVYIRGDHGRIRRICDISIKYVNKTSHEIVFAISD